MAATSTFIEVCAGTAAASSHLVGGKKGKPPVPYAGSKRRLAPRIAQLLWLGDSLPDRIILTDPSEWGRTLHTLLVARQAEAVAGVLESWIGRDDRELFDELRGSAPPPDAAERAATHLYLQTRTYRGKPVAPRAEGWITHGFDPEYRLAIAKLAGSKDRGWFNARPVLAKKVREWGAHPWPDEVDVRQCGALDLLAALSGSDLSGTVCYIDPPYDGTLGYPDVFAREDVITVARALADQGARVGVSEAVDLSGELGPGWTGIPLATKRGSPFRVEAGKKEQGKAVEWLTVSSDT